MSENVVLLLLAFCYFIIISLIIGITSYLIMKQQAKKFKTVFVRINRKGDSKFVRPVRIALVSDFHIPKMPPSKSAVLNSVFKNSPDCVIIAGDLCENKNFIEKTADFVGMIAEECRCPVLIVLGNHDIRDACERNEEKIKEYLRILEGSHPLVTTLVDEKYIFECSGANRKILFGGLNDYRFTSADKISALAEKWDYEAKNNSSEFILLSHNPDAALHIPDKCSLTAMLSGHTHAGQMWLPFNIEFRFMRKDILPKRGYKYGLHNYENRFPIYITSGVGCSFLPIRFRSTAEIAIIDI